MSPLSLFLSSRRRATPRMRMVLTVGAIAGIVPLQAVSLAAQTASLPVPENAVHFLVFGGAGGPSDSSRRKVAAQMARTAAVLRPEFALLTGNTISSPAGVKSADDSLWRSAFETVYGDPALPGEWYPVLGEEDYRGNPQAVLDYGQRNRRWHMPARYYIVHKIVDDSTSADFFFLDTSPYIAAYRTDSSGYALGGTDTVAQRRWLDSALAASHAQWKFVVGHHPIFSGGESGPQIELDLLLVPRMERYGVHAYFSGHERDLQHIGHPGGRTHYFVSGAAADSRETNYVEGTRYAVGTPGFLTVSLTNAEMLVQMIDQDGVLLYQGRLMRKMKVDTATPAQVTAGAGVGAGPDMR